MCCSGNARWTCIWKVTNSDPERVTGCYEWWLFYFLQFAMAHGDRSYGVYRSVAACIVIPAFFFYLRSHSILFRCCLASVFETSFLNNFWFSNFVMSHSLYSSDRSHFMWHSYINLPTRNCSETSLVFTFLTRYDTCWKLKFLFYSCCLLSCAEE